MPVILIINKLGSVKELNIKEYDEKDLYKKAGIKSDTDFQRHHQWDIELNGEKMAISIYGKTSGRAGQENKYELPPPVDNTLFFGSVVLLCMNTEDEVISMSADKWEKIYEALYGGFEDIGESDEDEEDDEDIYDDIPKTKSGYAKDGFVVDDEDDDDEADYDESDTESEEEVIQKKSKKKSGGGKEKPPTVGKTHKPKSQKKSVFEKIDTSIPIVQSQKEPQYDGELTEEEYV